MLKDLIEKLFGSKKLGAFVIGLVTLVLQDLLGVPEEIIKYVVTLISTYIIGQGIADVNKEAAKVNAKK